jgi:toxin YoeB
MRNITFLPEAFEEFTEWGLTNRTIQKKITALLFNTAREPFTGLGKPEPLKHSRQGYWSRRITQEHRLVYAVQETAITIISCKTHYSNI